MRSKSLPLLSLIVASSLALPSVTFAQRRPVKQKPAQTAPPPSQAKPGALKPYKEVVTADAKTQQGVFLVHRIDEKILWEIPAEMLGRDFLWQTEIAEIPAESAGGFGLYPGTNLGTHVVSFERRQNRIFMRERQFNMRTTAKDGLAEGVRESNIDPIIGSFDVETEGKNKSAVVDVSRQFLSDAAPGTAGPALQAAGVDPGRSYIDRVTAFPTNIETRSWLTFGAPSAKTALVHYSLDLLPEKPMMGRYRDDRVGFFSTGFQLYDEGQNKAQNLSYINRFRLEKKNPDAAMSDPVKPIVFYVSRETPDQWRPYLKQAVEAWQVAFQQAGFSNAIVCKDAPTRKEDPNWDPEDARYSVIRWEPSPVENAMGPGIQDPRSGETLSSHIIVWHNALKLAEDWYFSQVGAIDPSARHLPFSDELEGRLIKYIVTHEVGHTLGLEHNFKASAAWSVAQLRTPGFVSENGVAASIMSYSRFNYVSQPGDNLKPDDMLGHIGPYDKFAIKWGYTPIPGVVAPDQEKPELDRWASQQVNHPELRFGNYLHNEDPTTQSECIGSDPVLSTRLGLANIDRTVQYLIPVTARYGENYDDLRGMYQGVVGQRATELLRLVRYVGGVVESNWHAGHGTTVFEPVPRAKQAEAVKLVTDYGFHMPKALLDPTILTKIMSTGQVNLATSIPKTMMLLLFGESRMQRMLDNEAMHGANAYTIANLYGDVQTGVWDELHQPSVKIDLFRRTTQMAFLTTIDTRINGGGATKTDLNPIARDGLKDLAVNIDRAIPRAADAATARHLRESRRLIGLIVLGKMPAPGTGAPDFSSFFGIQDKPGSNEGCWPQNPLLKMIEDNR